MVAPEAGGQARLPAGRPRALSHDHGETDARKIASNPILLRKQRRENELTEWSRQIYRVVDIEITRDDATGALTERSRGFVLPPAWRVAAAVQGRRWRPRPSRTSLS